MNSVILSALAVWWNGFVKTVKQSRIYAAINKIYMFFSDGWKKSAFIERIKGIQDTGSEQYSILYKVVFFPFYILGMLKRSEKAKELVKNNILVRAGAEFFDNAVALNTRFFGILILTAFVARQIFVMRFLPLSAAFSVIGLILTFLNYNITDFFAGSELIKFALSTVGFSDIKWDIYNKESINTPLSLLLAVIIGIVSGELSVVSKLYILVPAASVIGLAALIRYPITGVFFAVFAAPFVPTMALAGLVVMTAFGVFVKSVFDNDFKWRLDGVGTGLGFFLVFMLVSCIFSFAVKKSIMVWGMYFIFIGFYFIIINTVKTREQLYSIIKFFVIAGILVSIYGILQYIFGWNTKNAWIDETMFSDDTMRAYSTMGNPNVLGEYLLLFIPLSFCIFLRALKKHEQSWVWFLAICVGMLCMLFTQSRGCWIGLFFSIVIFVTFYNGRLWGLLPLIILILPMIIPQTMVERFLSVGNTEDSSTSYRVFIWRGTLLMLKDFWVGGIGMGEGAFNRVYPFYSFNAIIAPHSHNLFLQLLVEGGISALLIFLSIMVVYIKKMSMLFSRKGRKDTDGIFALLCVCAVAGFLLQSMFDYTFYNYRMMAMFFMMLALSVSMETFEEVGDA